MSYGGQTVYRCRRGHRGLFFRGLGDTAVRCPWCFDDYDEEVFMQERMLDGGSIR